MEQTVIMKNLKKLYYNNGIIEKEVSPFYLSMLLYDDKAQFEKDKKARMELLSNTLTGIDKLRFLIVSINYYNAHYIASINIDLYIDYCKEILKIIVVDKKWKRNVVMSSLDIIVNSNLSRRIMDNSKLTHSMELPAVKGTKQIDSKNFSLDKELKDYLVSLDSRYNRYMVDDII